jgi:hypothetical protein
LARLENRRGITAMESGGIGLWVAYRSSTFSAFLFSRLKNSLEGIASFEKNARPIGKTVTPGIAFVVF